MGYENIGFKEYQQRLGLNQSTIKDILKSPQKWALGAIQKPESKALDFGSLCHDLILSPDEIKGKYLFADSDKLDFRLKKDKELKAQADEKGLILIDKLTRSEAEKLINNNFFFFDKFLDKKNGDCELSYFGEYKGVMCKARFDYISKDRKSIADLKFLQSATKDDFSKAVANFGYYIQAAFYLELTGANEFLFLAVEKTEPYLIGVYKLDTAALDLGKERVEKAIEIYKNKEYFAENFYFESVNQVDKDIVQIVNLPTYEYYKGA